MLTITYNIQYGKGRDERFDLDRIAASVADADVIAFQEIEAYWDRSGNVHQPEEIARRLPHLFWVYGPTVDIDKGGHDADGNAINRRRQFGNAIFSRWPITASRNHLYPKFAALNAHSIQRGALEATIAGPGGAFRAYSTHLCHLSADGRAEQLSLLMDIHERAPFDGPVSFGPHKDTTWLEEPQAGPVPAEAMILGDLNFQPDSAEYDLIAGPVSQHYGRLRPLGGFRDAWVAAGHGEAEGPTFYRDRAARTGVRIDYCFLTAGLAARVRDVQVDAEAAGSDHQPVRIRLED